MAFAPYDVVVFGAGLEEPASPERQRTAAIIGRLAALRPATRVFGYVALGDSQGSPTPAIVARIGRWHAMGVRGIFLDDLYVNEDARGNGVGRSLIEVRRQHLDREEFRFGGDADIAAGRDRSDARTVRGRGKLVEIDLPRGIARFLPNAGRAERVRQAGEAAGRVGDAGVGVSRPRLEVEIGESVWLESQDARIAIQGALIVYEAGGTLRAYGSLEAVRGTYTLRVGQVEREFEVVRGTVQFSGTPELNPRLDIVARHEVRTRDPGTPDIGILVNVGGTLQQPTLALSSETRPPLPESELLTLLLFGRRSTDLANIPQEFTQGIILEQLVGGVLTSELEQAFASLGIFDYVRLRSRPTGTGFTGVPQFGADIFAYMEAVDKVDARYTLIGLFTLAVIAAAYAGAALAVGLLRARGLEEIARSIMWGAVNGTASTLLAIGFLPLAEWFTRVTTNQTLMELADPKHPLLQRLSLEAPGTYAHTISVANLAEAVCNAIGANALLARVGVYYHDVGKIAKPQYFIENQPRGRNPHDKLKPAMSAAVVRSHVVEGLRLATEYRLPQAVKDFIAQHHGTQPISFFLDQARAADPGARLNPADFAYGGPRPQTREVAVVMMADSVESAARVLQDPSPPRIRDLVGRIVDAKIAAGQLDECPLTLREIHVAKEVLAKVLSGMYHQRLDYPVPAGNGGGNGSDAAPAAPEPVAPAQQGVGNG